MGEYVAKQVTLEMSKSGSVILNSKVLVLGITFKENCPDLRNSKVVDVVSELEKYGASVDVYDPWVTKDDAKNNLKIDLIAMLLLQVHIPISCAPRTCLHQ